MSRTVCIMGLVVEELIARVLITSNGLQIVIATRLARIEARNWVLELSLSPALVVRNILKPSYDAN